MSDQRTREKVKAAFLAARRRYEEDSRTDSTNFLLMGEHGTGKTFSLRTARKPVYVHQFDPGGANSLNSLIKKGQVIVDAQFQRESAKKPTAFAKWDMEFQQMRRDKLFDHIGTYVIDSATTWGEAILNEVLKRSGRAGQVPQIQDYNVQILTMKDYIKVCCGLPCDFVLTAHLEYIKDEERGKIIAVPLVTGKFSEYLPLLFDEVYVAQTVVKGSGTTYRWLTQNDGKFRARSRLAEAGKINKYEPPSFKKILRKGEKLREDLPTYFDVEYDDIDDTSDDVGDEEVEEEETKPTNSSLNVE